MTLCLHVTLSKKKNLTFRSALQPRRGTRVGAALPYGMYVYVYECTHTHTYIHTCMHTYIHTYMHTYMHAYIHAYIHTCVHTYLCGGRKHTLYTEIQFLHQDTTFTPLVHYRITSKHTRYILLLQDDKIFTTRFSNFGAHTLTFCY